MGSLSFLQGNLPDPGIKPGSPTLQVESLLAKLPGKPTKLLGLTSEFNKTSGYKDNPQISIAFLYTNSEKSKKEIKRTTLNKWFWEKWTTFCHPHGL